MAEQQQLIERTVKRVTAILDEASVQPRTGRMEPGLGTVPEGTSITNLIDYTLLKPEATARDIEMICLEARLYPFASVCVNSVYVPLAAELLRETDVKVCTVVGFPLGASLPTVKVTEAFHAIEQGAQEIDMVLHIGALRGRDFVGVFEDISDVAVTCHDADVLLKVIIETALLTDEEKILACQIAKMAGADFVKTSTGFSTAGATTKDVALMRAVVGEGVGVKASGGVKTLADAQAMVEVGATRIGASGGVTIAREELGDTLPADTSGEGDDY